MGYVAEYVIQPDDRNHLVVRMPREEIYVRANVEDLKCFLLGEAPSWIRNAPKDVREKHLKIAQLFKQGLIEKIVFTNASGVKPRFEFEAKPEDIEIKTRGLADIRYILHLEDEDVVIRPLVPSRGGAYPFEVRVERLKREESKIERAKNLIQALIVRIEAGELDREQIVRELVKILKEL